MDPEGASSPGLLDRIVTAHRHRPAVAQKARIGAVTAVLPATDWLRGPGDDAAAVSVAAGEVLAAGEAMSPAFVAADPYGAGIGAVVANVNDIAAMGGRCLGIVDTIVGPEEVAREILRGLAWAAGCYGVPILGGHLTVTDDGPASLSAFAVGHADAVLASRNVAPGQVLLSAACLDGRLRDDFPFLPSFRTRGERVRGDLELLPALARAGDCVAAKDVSMAGLLGTLAMLLEPSRCGVSVDLEAVPRPAEVAVERWLEVFPSYGFLLCAPPDRVERTIGRFHARGLACVPVGVVDDSGILRVRHAGEERTVAAVGGATGIGGRPAG